MAEKEQVKARGDDHKFMQPQLCGKKDPNLFIHLFTPAHAQNIGKPWDRIFCTAITHDKIVAR